MPAETLKLRWAKPVFSVSFTGIFTACLLTFLNSPSCQTKANQSGIKMLHCTVRQEVLISAVTTQTEAKARKKRKEKENDKDSDGDRVVAWQRFA